MTLSARLIFHFYFQSHKLENARNKQEFEARFYNFETFAYRIDEYGITK